MDGVSYDQLPQRKIIQAHFERKKIFSYGIMAYAKDTKRWLMIQPNHTFGLTMLLFGAYRPVYLEDILSNMTKPEVLKIREIVAEPSSRKAEELFEDLYMEYTGLMPPSYYSLHRMRDHARFILVFDINTLAEHQPFGFPKGKQKQGEDTIVSAAREFYEETGLKVTDSIIPQPVEYSDKRSLDRSYIAKCWIYILNEEVDLDKYEIIDKKEVKSREWVQVNEHVTVKTSYKHLPKAVTSTGEEVHISFETMQLVIQAEKCMAK